jgi:hypothetical protein
MKINLKLSTLTNENLEMQEMNPDSYSLIHIKF